MFTLSLEGPRLSQVTHLLRCCFKQTVGLFFVPQPGAAPLGCKGAVFEFSCVLRSLVPDFPFSNGNRSAAILFFHIAANCE